MNSVCIELFQKGTRNSLYTASLDYSLVNNKCHSRDARFLLVPRWNNACSLTGDKATKLTGIFGVSLRRSKVYPRMVPFITGLYFIIVSQLSLSLSQLFTIDNQDPFYQGPILESPIVAWRLGRWGG